MKTEELSISLNNFILVKEELDELLTAVEKTAKQKLLAKKILLCSMEQEIAYVCSSSFLNQMVKEVSRDLKEINLFGYEPKSNLDYLVEVIFITLTGSSRVIGLEHFVAPGNTYEESCEFCDKFFKDFTKVKEIFNIEFSHCPDVKIGYAFKFYKS